MDTTKGLQVHSSAAGRSLLGWAEANPYPECLFQEQPLESAVWGGVSIPCSLDRCAFLLGEFLSPISWATQLASHGAEMSLPC